MPLYPRTIQDVSIQYKQTGWWIAIKGIPQIGPFSLEEYARRTAHLVYHFKGDNYDN